MVSGNPLPWNRGEGNAISVDEKFIIGGRKSQIKYYALILRAMFGRNWPVFLEVVLGGNYC